ncbi:peroxiredoxin, partial [Streptomyces sp. NPDC088921]
NYGKTYMGVIRSTVIVDEEGKVDRALYNVRATGHVAKIIKDLGI